MLSSIFGNANRGAHIVAASVQQDGIAQEHDRQKRIATAWERYEGAFPPPLKATKNDPQGDDNVILNLARMVVDTSAFFLFGKGVSFEVAGQSKSEAGDWLEACWQENDKNTLLLDMGINGGVSGDVFVRVREAGPGEEYPRLLLLDSGNVTVTTAPDDYQRVVKYSLQWTAPDPESGKPIVYRHVLTPNAGGRSWQVVEEHSRPNAAAWLEDASYTFPYRFAPIFHAKNRPAPLSFYGTADLEADVLDTNNDLNFAVSNISRILRTHAHPKTWGKGFNAKQIDLSVDSLTIFDSREADLKNLEMQTDLTSSLELVKRLKEAFHELTSIPEIAAGKVDNIGQLSGVALQILYGPLIRLTEMKRLTYGAMLCKLNAALLQMRKAGAAKVLVTCQWPPALPKDALTEANAAIAKQQAGVSKDTTLTELGYNPQVEEDKRNEEAQTAADLGANLLEGFEKGQLQG